MIRVSSTVWAMVAASKPRVYSGTRRSANTKHEPREHEQRDEHEVRDGRHDPPGAPLAVGREQAGDDRDERRGQGPGRDELEDQVGDPERGEERVELGRVRRAALPMTTSRTQPSTRETRNAPRR